jgi:general L-amino acid transport system permease protein
MSATTTLPGIRVDARQAPATRIDWRRGLFGSWTNLTITVAYAALAWWVVRPLLGWAIWNATFIGDQERCRRNGGACWVFITEKLRFILFGFYPGDAQWRPALACVLLLTLIVAIALPRLWVRFTVPAALAGLALVILLLLGVPGGAYVAPEQWGGLPVTLLLPIIAFGGAFPLAVVLALARRSKRAGFRWLAIGFIEIVRGVPFISILYLATLLFPLMLPHGASIDKFARAQIALILFVAAYLAEIVRAGLQGVPVGQYEASRSVGLSHVQTLRLVIMPQALRSVIPSMVNLALGIFQDTTLVLVIGMFDLLNTARAAAADPGWLGYYNEAFAFVALWYFLSCFALSRYSLWLERHLGRALAR